MYTLVQLRCCKHTWVNKINVIWNMIISFQRQVPHCCHHKDTTLGTPTRRCTKHVTANLLSWVVLREATLNVQAFQKVWLCGSQASACLCSRLRAGPEVIKPYLVLMFNSILTLRSHAHGGYKTSWVRTQLSMPPWAYPQWRANEGARLKRRCFFINRRSRNGTLSLMKVRIHVNKCSVVC